MIAERRKARRALCALLVAASACAPRLAPLPAGAGAPFPDASTAYDDATRRCRGVRSLVGVMGLSGRAGRARLRGNIEVGLDGDRVRLEAPGPFGSRPVFVLVARGSSATLLLPRDRRVLTGAAPEAIVEALAGVPLTPAELRAVLTGCGLAADRPATNGRQFAEGWVAVDVGGTTQWLQRVADAWRLVGSRRGDLEVRYPEFESNRPAVIRVRRAAGGDGADTDFTIRLSQVDLNVPVEAAAFEVEIPPDAEPITLDELRRAGPLGDRSSGPTLQP